MQPSSRNLSFHPVLAAAAATALILALAGCEAANERASEAAIESALHGEAEVERDGERTVIRTADGEVAITAGENLELPSDYPDDVYLPDDYNVQSVVGTREGGHAIGFTTGGSVEQALADARAQMQEHGWEQVGAMQHPQGEMLSFQKGERVAMLVLSGADDGRVRVSVTVAPAQ